MSSNFFLITGASSDIGREVIRALEDPECVVLAHGNKGVDKIEKMRSEVLPQIIPIQADLASEEGLDKLISAVLRHCPHPNKILHLPAPRPQNTRFKDLSWQDFQRDIDIQLRSAVEIMKEFAPKMAAVKKGKILFMLSSVTLGVPYKNLLPYVTSKYALLGLMKALAAEYNTKNLQVNAISPSIVQTSFLSNTPEKAVELAAEQHPLKRNALPKDLVPLIHFLLSENADFLSGANIPVTGGLTF
jgi:3-oxoacyl-[acyl-carrier protein] reductase